jgi:hypothetical protein
MVYTTIVRRSHSYTLQDKAEIVLLHVSGVIWSDHMADVLLKALKDTL